MSASREKKTRQDVAPQGPTSREQRKQKDTRGDQQGTTVYVVVGVLCAMLAAFLVVWNMGIIQRSAAAATVNGTKYTATDVQYYFNSTRQNTINMYYNYMGTAPFDTNTSTKTQVYNPETGETWFDYFMTSVLTSLERTTAMANKAKAEGHVLSATAQETYNTFLADIETVWEEYGFSNRDDFIRANYGEEMTYARLLELLNLDLLASDYATAVQKSFSYTDAEYQSYYQENASELDSFVFTQFPLVAQVTPTTDADGKSIEMTEEETAAALELAKTEVSAIAEEIKAKLASGTSADALAEEYVDSLSSTPSLAQEVMGSGITASAYGSWLQDAARKAGDITVIESDGGSSMSYHVVRFESRQRSEDPSCDVRHILIAAETDEGATEPTQAQYDAAQTKALELLEQWKNGEATEDAFAALAKEHSADSGSAAEGGLISGITPYTSFVPTFSEWVLDASRQSGDTGLVQNTGSSVKGWHLMYYVGDGDPAWKLNADNALRSEAYTQWEDATIEGHTASTGLGMKFVQG